MINNQHAALLSQWMESLANTTRDTKGKSVLPVGLKTGHDLLSVLQRIVGRGGIPVEEDLQFHIETVRTGEYLITDLFAEVTSLAHAFDLVLLRMKEAELGEFNRALDTVQSALSQLFAGVLEQTAGIYEQVIETGHQPICLLNLDGQVTYTNSAMRNLLRRPPVARTQFINYVATADREFVADSLRGDRLDEPHAREIQLLKGDTQTIRVNANIHPVFFRGTRVGTYATFTDNSEVIAQEQKFLDRLSLAAIKVDQDLRITYANPATMALLGTRIDIMGRDLYSIFQHDNTMDQQLEKRLGGKGDFYEAEIVRPSDGKVIPIQVIGAPVLDDRQQFRGSLGILRSLEREKAAEEIHRLIDTERDDHKLLEGTAEQIRQLVPFNYFGVSVHSIRSEHISSAFSWMDDNPPERTRRWWPIAPGQRAAFERPLITDFASFIHEERSEIEHDPEVEAFIKRGFQTLMRFPISEGGRVVASVSLLSKQPDAFSKADLETILALPVKRAVQMALYHADYAGLNPVNGKTM